MPKGIKTKTSLLLFQVQAHDDALFLLHWDGQITMLSAEDVLSVKPNDEISRRTLWEGVSSGRGDMGVADWFCVKEDAVALYNGSRVHFMEFKL